MYSAVPTTIPVPVMLPMAKRATPKSMILTPPSSVRKTLAGLMSRCTIPTLCAWARPSSTETTIAILRSRLRGGVARIMWKRSLPLRNSIAM